MPSTLTAPGKDGKQSKNFERNTRNVAYGEILFSVLVSLLLVIAQTFGRAQSKKVELRAGMLQ